MVTIKFYGFIIGQGETVEELAPLMAHYVDQGNDPKDINICAKYDNEPEVLECTFAEWLELEENLELVLAEFI